jgi:hypothetical protein
MVRDTVVVAIEPYQVYAGVGEHTIANAEDGADHGPAIGKTNGVLVAQKNCFFRVGLDDFDLANHLAGRVGKLHKHAELTMSMRIRRRSGRTDSVKNAYQMNISRAGIRQHIVAKYEGPCLWHKPMGNLLRHEQPSLPSVAPKLVAT